MNNNKPSLLPMSSADIDLTTDDKLTGIIKHSSQKLSQFRENECVFFETSQFSKGRTKFSDPSTGVDYDIVQHQLRARCSNFDFGFNAGSLIRFFTESERNVETVEDLLHNYTRADFVRFGIMQRTVKSKSRVATPQFTEAILIRVGTDFWPKKPAEAIFSGIKTRYQKDGKNYENKIGPSFAIELNQSFRDPAFNYGLASIIGKTRYLQPGERMQRTVNYTSSNLINCGYGLLETDLDKEAETFLTEVISNNQTWFDVLIKTKF